MPLILRKARREDAANLTNIMHRAKASWGYSEDLMAKWRDHWQITPEGLGALDGIVVEQDGTPVAFSGVTRNGSETAELTYFYVVPEAQRKGIGQLLLKRSEDQARRAGAARMALRSEVNAGGFYEVQGYRTIGHEPSQMAPGKFMPLMEKGLSDNVLRVGYVELTLSKTSWPFEIENATAIDTHFAKALEQNPHLWNGRLLILSDYRYQDGRLKGTCRETSFSAFMAWRDWGAPCEAFNIFGSTILRTSDGCDAYGVMAEHTATAGQIYPPGGNLDPADVDSSGRIDVTGAVRRELKEETGIREGDSRHQESLVVFDGARVAIVHVHDIDVEGEALREQIVAHSFASEEKELADIRLIRSTEDLKDPAIASHARSVGRYLLKERTSS